MRDADRQISLREIIDHLPLGKRQRQLAEESFDSMSEAEAKNTVDLYQEVADGLPAALAAVRRIRGTTTAPQATSMSATSVSLAPAQHTSANPAKPDGWLNDEEYDVLVRAADEYLSAHGSLITLMSTLGSTIDQGLERLPGGFKQLITDKVREALDYAQKAALTEPDAGRQPLSQWHGALLGATGGLGGFSGLPAVLVELPITTVTILRSIADVARSKGENLDDVEVQATCLEAFAYGSPLKDDYDADLEFFATRVGAVGLANRKSTVELADVISRVAVRYSIAVKSKVALQAFSITGAGMGTGLNWSYMQFYQAMASVLFTLRPIELKYDRNQVRSCFAAIVRERKGAKAKESV